MPQKRATKRRLDSAEKASNLFAPIQRVAKRFRGTGDADSSLQSIAKRSARSSSGRAICSRYLSPDRIQQDKNGYLLCEPSDIIQHRYMVMRSLGEGTFGRVFAVRDLRNPSAPQVALKIVRNQDKYTQAARMEVTILKKLSESIHAGKNLCIHLLGSFQYHGHICLMFDMLGLSVYDVMKINQYHPFPPEHVRKISNQLIRAVDFLHSMKITHTDLKPENMLFIKNDYIETDPTSPPKGLLTKGPRKIRVMKDVEIRLIDFGSAVFDQEQHSNVVTTRHYRAPEVMLNVGWNHTCDIWSLGCIMFELNTGITLFQVKSDADHLASMERVIGPFPKQILGTIKTASAPYYTMAAGQIREVAERLRREGILHIQDLIKTSDHDTALLLDLVNRMLRFNPVERTSTAEALGHPYFTKKSSDCNLSWLGTPIYSSLPGMSSSTSALTKLNGAEISGKRPATAPVRRVDPGPSTSA